MQDVQNSKISVEKIGGASMTAFGDVLRHIMLYDRSRIYGRIYVVSAYSGVTNQLLEHKKTGERGILRPVCRRQGLSGRTGQPGHQPETQATPTWACRWMWPTPLMDQRIGQAREYLNAMHHVLASGYLSRKDVLLAAREVLASIGESHSAFRSVEILKANGVNALMDLAGFDDNEAWTIDERIAHSFKGLGLSDKGRGGHRLHQGHRRHHARV